MSFGLIEQYGVIGNMRSIALVCASGSIDFLCYPGFDSPTIFSALLDEERGGWFQIQPELNNRRVRQLYLPDTNILLTRFLAEEGVAELTDYMPISAVTERPNEIIRMVSVVRGEVRFRMDCKPRFNYGMCPHAVQVGERCAVFVPQDSSFPPMSLYSTTCLIQQAEDVTSEFVLRAGEKAIFIFGAARPPEQQPEMERMEERFRETVHFWKKWIAKSKYKGRWREMVNRSALMLKLLISREHGSLIAAPTFSLPEAIGGEHNWDYRYTWLRDATFTLYALIRLGFVEEAEAFIDWLKDRLSDDAERGPLQVMYGIDGRQKLDESILEHLRGYENSRPVRIGNAAYQQLQLDIYGEMMGSIYLANKYGDAISYARWQDVQRMLSWDYRNLDGAHDLPYADTKAREAEDVIVIFFNQGL
jgi:GH15 family glucan-1,4-alpha-glucosidase